MPQASLSKPATDLLQAYQSTRYRVVGDGLEAEAMVGFASRGLDAVLLDSPPQLVERENPLGQQEPQDRVDLLFPWRLIVLVPIDWPGGRAAHVVMSSHDPAQAPTDGGCARRDS